MAGIPPELMQRLESLKPHLAHNGSLCRRRDRWRSDSWRLRVRVPQPDSSRPKQLSIPVSQEDLDSIDQLVAQWRKEHREDRRKEILERKQQFREFKATLFVSRRKEQFAIKVYKQAERDGPVAEWIMDMGRTYDRPSKPGGRPRKRWVSHVAGCLVPPSPQPQAPHPSISGNDVIEKKHTMTSSGAQISLNFDRGFYKNIPPIDQRPRRKARKTVFSGQPELNARWEAALLLHIYGWGGMAGQDAWVMHAARFLQIISQPGLKVPGKFRALAAAHRLYMDESPTRYRLEALICTGESDIIIARVLRLSCHTVRAYRRMFCDIDLMPQPQLHFRHSLWISSLNQYERWKSMALARGISGLFSLWDYEAGCQSPSATGTPSGTPA